jgi:hypothetical protein
MSTHAQTLHIASSLGIGGIGVMLDKLTVRGFRQDVSVIRLTTTDGPVGVRTTGGEIPFWLGLKRTWHNMTSLWCLSHPSSYTGDKLTVTEERTKLGQVTRRRVAEHYATGHVVSFHDTFCSEIAEGQS